MDINLPPKVRATIYALITVLSPVVTYLTTQGVLNDFYAGLFSVIVSAVSVLAYKNVTQ